MRTVLSQFCEEFEAAVRPLLDPLERTTVSLAGASRDVAAREILPGLRDLRHQLAVVADKVGEQQAYVLIFGPLKSGKSTLMNAMAAAYVSEVTSLPAYPCMVYVSHAEQREFVVTRYDGESELCSDLTALRMTVGRAHPELAAQMRLADAAGHDFDPRVHFASAIRRIDAKLPAGELAQSGAILVDTPGLYTRMKFRYDQMTREFRDTAACAIFVVKSENLFLEQVFEEFNALLALFSRIFLVVNLDTNKRDLRPDGTLAPSLECVDPARIIEAFEDLAMSAPLKAAAESGRLRIYPIDLLQSASRRLRGPAAEPAAAAAFPGLVDFDSFLSDLTEYLNSTDYLIAFLGDSIRRATTLLADVHAEVARPCVRQLARRAASLRSELERERRLAAVLGRLRAVEWNAAFRELRRELGDEARQRSGKVRARTASLLVSSIEGWFTSDASLHDLFAFELRPLVESLQFELAHLIHDGLGQRALRGAAGLELTEQVAPDLVAAGIDLGALGRAALIEVDSRPGAEATGLPLDDEAIPVRRGLLDRLLLRSEASVRRRLFGAKHRPDREIPQRDKAKKLGAIARDALRLALAHELDVLFDDVLDKLAARMYADYTARAQQTLRHALNTKSQANDGARGALEAALAEVEDIGARIAGLERLVAGAEGAMGDIAKRYGETQPELLIEAADEPTVEVAPAAPLTPVAASGPVVARKGAARA